MRLPVPALVAMHLMVAGTAVAATTELRLLTSSRIWLDGTTNVHAWHCVGDSLGAELSIDAPATELERLVGEWQARPNGARLEGPGEVSARWDVGLALRVPVAGLDCGNPAMEADMRKALRASEHPTIGYRFVRLRQARNAPAGPVPAFALQVEGEISLGGVRRPVVVDVTATRLAARHFRLRGGVPLRMTDFGIEPPVALMGLIRARDELWVSVDLEITLQEDGGVPIATPGGR